MFADPLPTCTTTLQFLFYTKSTARNPCQCSPDLVPLLYRFPILAFQLFIHNFILFDQPFNNRQLLILVPIHAGQAIYQIVHLSTLDQYAPRETRHQRYVALHFHPRQKPDVLLPTLGRFAPRPIHHRHRVWLFVVVRYQEVFVIRLVRLTAAATAGGIDVTTYPRRGRRCRSRLGCIARQRVGRGVVAKSPQRLEERQGQAVYGVLNLSYRINLCFCGYGVPCRIDGGASRA
mmetsp:Transcript_39261/g.80447  ORF Transcript_39261/g.80447 Transcript_39261/m.80447 type:complete len:233 (+) Transcript_39261:1598-2296(+)